MGEPQAIQEDVRFDHAAAAALAEEFRSTARIVGSDVGERTRVGATAAEEWEGAYGTEFDTRLATCTGDGDGLVDGLNHAAQLLDDAAEDAREEQQRREDAREEERRREEEEADRNLLERGWDWVTGS